MADTINSSPPSVYIPLPVNLQILNDQRKQISRVAHIDSVNQSEKKEPLYITNSEAPNLQAPQKGGTPDYLYYLAEAFCNIYKEMTKTSVSAVDDLTDLQTFDQALGNANIQLTHNAIDKQEKAFKANQKLAAEVKKNAQEDKVSNEIGWAIGGVLIALTLASALVDFGASLAAVPEELSIEMTETGATSAMTSASEGGTEDATAMEDMASNTEVKEGPDSSDIGKDGVPNYMKETSDLQGKTSELDQSIFKDQENDIKAQQTRSEDEVNLRNNSRFARAQKFLTCKAYRASLGLGTGIAFATPQAMQGLASINLSKYQHDLAEVQREVGPALGALQANGVEIQYFQELVQRQSGIASQSIEQLSNVIDIASSLFGAFRQLSVALSQAV